MDWRVFLLAETFFAHHCILVCEDMAVFSWSYIYEHKQSLQFFMLKASPFDTSLRSNPHIVKIRDTHYETGDPARLPFQLAGRWGQRSWNSLRWGKKNILYWADERPWQNKNLLYRHGKPNESTKKEPVSFVLFESPFTSVSTVSRVHCSLLSLVKNVTLSISFSVFLCVAGRAYWYESGGGGMEPNHMKAESLVHWNPITTVFSGFIYQSTFPKYIKCPWQVNFCWQIANGAKGN
jgi:hypothetical protein